MAGRELGVAKPKDDGGMSTLRACSKVARKENACNRRNINRKPLVTFKPLFKI